MATSFMDQPSAIIAPEVPALPGYRIEQELNPTQTYLATASNGRRVVLKRLDEDCLLKGQLHPLIRDRLARVRELAHLGVANLCAVERCGEFAFMVWEYVEGQTLADYIAAHGGKCGIPRALGYELAVCVESLHALGIVHGAVHDRNIIITPSGAIRLTHVSPLLYNDLSVDVEATLYWLGEMGCQAALEEIPAESPPLRDVAAHLAAWSKGAANQTPALAVGDTGSGIRRRTLLAAGAVAIVGMSMAAAAFGWAKHAEQSASDRRSAAEDSSARILPVHTNHAAAYRISELPHRPNDRGIGS
jgi:hypothetical protein